LAQAFWLKLKPGFNFKPGFTFSPNSFVDLGITFVTL